MNNGKEFFRRELPGGIRLVGERDPGRRSAAFGVWLQVGSRDEQPGFEGVAHFIEHLVFKGTRQRTGQEIAASLERVGGSLDAFTTKDTTCFHARILEEHLDLAADVVCDLVSAPLFRQEDIELERGVVLEELRNVEDSPEDLLGDLAMQYLWPDDIMGASILGTRESLGRLDSGTITEFHQNRYRSPRVVVGAAGAVDPDRLAGWIGERLHLPQEQDEDLRRTPGIAEPVFALHQSDLSQLYLMFLAPGPSDRDPRRRAAHLLAELFGGGMSSRLFQTIREEAGLAYSVYSYLENYDDTGLFATGLAVSPARAEEAVTRTVQEMSQLLGEGLKPGELEAAKAQVRGSLIMGLESLTNRMTHLARTEFRLGRPESLEETLAEYEAVTEADLLETAAELLHPDRLSLVALGPASPEVLAFKSFPRTVRVEET